MLLAEEVELQQCSRAEPCVGFPMAGNLGLS